MTELLVVVAIIGVLTAVGIPTYSGYVASSKLESAKIGLRMIQTAQIEYRSDTGSFCAPTACGSAAAINTTLFNGQQSLDVGSDYSFAVISATGGTLFTASATNGSKTCEIDQTGAISGC